MVPFLVPFVDNMVDSRLVSRPPSTKVACITRCFQPTPVFDQSQRHVGIIFCANTVSAAIISRGQTNANVRPSLSIGRGRGMLRPRDSEGVNVKQNGRERAPNNDVAKCLKTMDMKLQIYRADLASIVISFCFAEFSYAKKRRIISFAQALTCACGECPIPARDMYPPVTRQERGRGRNRLVVVSSRITSKAVNVLNFSQDRSDYRDV